MHILNELVILFIASVVVVFIFQKLRIPTIIGFLITGVLCGPHALRFVASVHDVETLSELGIILLLFTIGLEFSAKGLSQIRRAALSGGTLQLLLTAAIVAALALAMGKNIPASIATAFIVTLSSTAIVMKLYQERGQVDTPHGRITLAILIFQDIAAIVMLLLLPLISSGAIGKIFSTGAALSVLKGIILIAALIAARRWLISPLLHLIAGTRSKELFILSIFVLCFGTAWLTYYVGLSLAFGAFLAGLIISDTEYSHEAAGNILPFKDIFLSIFFVSTGMLLDPKFAAAHFPVIILLTVIVLIGKSFLTTFAVVASGYPLRTAIMSGFALAQIGEFSFILAQASFGLGVIDNAFYQILLIVSIFTMMATPSWIKLSGFVARRSDKLRLPSALRYGYYGEIETESAALKLNDHLIIIGYGVNGKNVSWAAREAGIPYVIIEMNPDTVKREKEKGEAIFYGDASRDSILAHAQITKARAVVIAIPDPIASRRIVVAARRMNSALFIIARTRFTGEMKSLYELGADEVIPEEFETSVRIFSSVMRRYYMPENEIRSFSDHVRSDCYSSFTEEKQVSAIPDEIRSIPGMSVLSFRVEDSSAAIGRTLAELNVRKNYGVMVIMIRRGESNILNPDGDVAIAVKDILVLSGEKAGIDSFVATIESAADDGAHAAIPIDQFNY